MALVQWPFKAINEQDQAAELTINYINSIEDMKNIYYIVIHRILLRKVINRNVHKSA